MTIGKHFSTKTVESKGSKIEQIQKQTHLDSFTSQETIETLFDTFLKAENTDNFKYRKFVRFFFFLI